MSSQPAAARGVSLAVWVLIAGWNSLVAASHLGESTLAAQGAAATGAARPARRAGRRRRDDTYLSVGGRCGQEVLAGVLERLGAAAELPVELRHPHALRHTCATEMRRAGADVGDVRILLGHASVKTTSVCLASDQDRQEHVVQLRERGRPTLDDDRDAISGDVTQRPRRSEYPNAS
jgi:hypothetical protein